MWPITEMKTVIVRSVFFLFCEKFLNRYDYQGIIANHKLNEFYIRNLNYQQRMVKILLKCLQKTNLFNGDVDHCNIFEMI